MKFLDFFFVLVLLYFNCIVTQCCNLSVRCISQLERSPESSLCFPPPHCSITHILDSILASIQCLLNTPCNSILLRLCLCCSLFLRCLHVFIKVLFMHKSQNVTSFCEAFRSFWSPSLSIPMEAWLP